MTALLPHAIDLVFGPRTTPTPNVPSDTLVQEAPDRSPLIGAPSAERWRDLLPTLHLGGQAAGPCVRTRPIGAPEVERALGDLRDDGVLELPELLYSDDAARMAAAVTALRRLGLPPLFLFVFDEPWALAARVSAVVGQALGPDYRLLPDFWSWFVAPSDNDRGWVPHRDRPGLPKFDGMPASMTLWVALTDATPRNGCMVVLPKRRDAHYGTDLAQDLTRDELQDVRALPARAGTALMWDQDVYHWGGRSSARAAGPRISLALEFQRGDLDPLNAPLLDPAAPPDFHDRLRLIGKQLLQYQHMHPLSPALTDFATRMVAL